MINHDSISISVHSNSICDTCQNCQPASQYSKQHAQHTPKLSCRSAAYHQVAHTENRVQTEPQNTKRMFLLVQQRKLLAASLNIADPHAQQARTQPRHHPCSCSHSQPSAPFVLLTAQNIKTPILLVQQLKLLLRWRQCIL